jgi:hypothetical protein
MRANATASAYVSTAPAAAAQDTRERGFALVSRVNRWMVAGAVVVAGGVTAVTAHAFHPHQAVVRTAAPASPAASSQPSAAPSDNGGGLQPPSQAPQSVAPAAPAPVVSGGS